MDKNRILNIATAIVALAVCYILIFEDSRNNTLFWGSLALFFILLAARARKKKVKEQR